MRALPLALVLGISVCSLNSTAAAEYKIGVLLKGRENFWNAVEQGAKDAGVRLGAEVIVKAPMTEAGVSAQIQMLNAFAAQQVDCIVLAPIDAETLVKPVEALVAQGIKLILLDSPLNSEVGSLFIGIDHQAAGATAGKLLAELVTDTDQIAIFRHAQRNVVTTAREESAITALRSARPELVIYSDVYSGDNKELQPERAQTLLSKHPQVTAVLASNTSSTMAMLHVLAQQPHPGAIKLVGFGYNLNSEVAAAIEADILYGWIAQLPAELGRIGVVHAVALLDGKTGPRVVHAEFMVITKKNLHNPEVQALLKL